MVARFDESDLIASITRDSFFEFFKEFWPTIIHEPLELNWHIEYICKVLQRAAERVFLGLPKEWDLIFNVPPGTSKSSIGSIMYPAWIFARMPSARCVCVSHTDSLVLDLSRKCRDVVTSEKYQACFGVARKYKGKLIPAVEIKDDQNTKGYWATTQGGMRFCATVGGKTPTGMHGHFLITDDPTDPQKVTSEAELKEANRWMSETLPTRKVNKKTAVSILIMQRLHQDDPTGRRLENKKAGRVKHVCLPAKETPDIKPSYLKSRYDRQDGFLDPVRLPDEVLEEQRAILGEYGYAGQYDQSPIPLGGGLFKWQQLRQDVLPPEGWFKRIVRYWDTAGSTKNASAFSAGVKIGLDIKGRFWVLDVVRGRWASEEREAHILQTARHDAHKVKVMVEQQPGSSGMEVARATIKMLAGFNAAADRPTGDKQTRAIPFSVQVNNGNVFVPLGALWLPDYLNEIKFFPNSRFKDQIDASSGAFNELTRRQTVGGVRGL